MFPNPNRSFRRPAVPDYPQMITPVKHIEPVPRRVRAFIGATKVLDTTHALYVWETQLYPQFYVPLADVNPSVLVDEDHVEKLRLGPARRYGLKVGDVAKPGVGHAGSEGALDGLVDMIKFDWAAMDAWFEEDERIFVHPRSPYTRVDALRSTRPVRIELDGVVLADTTSPVMLFETGLPTRYYINRTDVHFEHLRATGTVSECPYKGTTSGYWSVVVGDVEHKDLAWAYDFPTRQALPIAGLIAFYNEKVDVFVDGALLERPNTHFS
jgi:uncharacterized protein (DUF427 family)